MVEKPGDEYRAEQSARLLDELRALSLDERWRLVAERDLRLRRLTDRDFAAFCGELGIHPPPGVTNAGENWMVPAAIEVRWSEDEARRRRVRLWGVALMTSGALVAGLVAGQAANLVRLWSEDTAADRLATLERSTDRLGGLASDAARDAGDGARLMSRAVEDLERMRLEIALERLHSSLETGRPFIGSLAPALANASLPESLRAPLTALKPYATDGIPTRAVLRRQFEDAAAKALVVGLEETALTGVCRDLAGLVAVDACGLRERAHRLTALREAHDALERGGLSEAITALRRLREPAAWEMTPWIGAAGARRKADEAMAAISAAALIP